MDEGRARRSRHYELPQQHRTKLHSTNPLERLNGEIKRRTRRRSASSQNEAAITPASSAQSCSNRNDEWSVQRARYISLETIAAMGDDEPVSPPGPRD